MEEELNIRDKVWDWAKETDSFQLLGEAALRYLSCSDIMRLLHKNDIHIKGVTEEEEE